MAAEVPAKDVLCEAMEYLSKLGSNLQTRSKNLKDKKIRREKLNNVLALQKAASKVLLICELSKKSLENVETGVRQVLEHIDISQASSSQGGKKLETINKDAENKSKYFYFEYKSRKLRIKKRISVKHYTSARVLAKCIPKSMIDKYPVHYDCKLYQMRKRERKLLKMNDDSKSCIEIDEDVSTGSAHGKTQNKKGHDDDMSTVTIPDSPTAQSVYIDKKDNGRKSVHENDISIISIPDTPISITSSNVNEVSKSTDNADKGKIRKSSGESTKEKRYSKDSDDSPKKKKFKEKEQPNDSSEKQKNHHKNTSEIRMKSSEAYNKSDNNEVEKKRFKKLRVINSSDDETKTDEKGKLEKKSEATKDNDIDVSFQEPEPKKRKLSVSTDKSQNADANSIEESKSEKDKEQNNEMINEFNKPLIKCVSLSKLLKPDVLIKDASKPHSKPKGSSKKERQTKVQLITKESLNNRKVDMQVEKVRQEKEYWAQKRKEISSFKSKNFVINITRLPELSSDYLNKINLKKITQSGITICEITDKNIGNEQLIDESDSEKSTSIRNENRMKKAKKDVRPPSTDKPDGSDDDLIAEANKVKYSLLNESDSEGDPMGVSSEKQSVNTNNDSVKNALLYDSDSENKLSNDELQSAQAQKAKNALHNESDSESDKHNPKLLMADVEKVENKLLEDTNSDFVKKTTSQNTQGEKVKKALLNAAISDSKSNSSDTAKKLKKPLLYYSNSESESMTSKNIPGNKINKALLNDSNSESESKSSDTAKKLKKPLLYYSNSESESITSKNISDNKINKALLNESNSDSESKTSKTNPSEKESKTFEPNSESEAAPKCKADKAPSEQDDNSNDENKKDNNDSVEKSGENLSISQRNERTPEKELLLSNSDDQAKSSLLKDSSEDKTKTPLSQRITTPQSKKKRMRESMHAKKMLLTYSSSDTEDEQLKNVLKEIKDSLLHGSDEENGSNKKDQKLQPRESSPSSSNEDILKKVKKKITYDSSSSKEKRIKYKRKKHQERLDSDSSANSKSASSSKMVRSKSKPGNSSSQNLDVQDSYDKDIDGLTNLNSLNKSKSRRRHSNASDATEESSSSNTRSSKQRGKPTGLLCQEMLKAETSSEAASASGEENLEEEDDLPPVTLPNFNGGAEHLVKEDLLGESDSSESPNESAKKDESDFEEQLNSKRRKANAISSDSEVGSSRKKDKDVKLSDFEDSDDSETMSRSKRKKKAIDSDASAGTTSSNEGGKKKRRRIKSLRESDVSGSESETEGRNKHGRKNIRKVMGKNQLEEATKKAAREEKERIARIVERQKMYNNLEFDESGKPDEVVLDKVVLDFDPDTKEPLIEVDRGLVKKLKPHQANGIKFMWNACFESARRIKKDKGSGCILAHCMGLGKTLQVVSLTHTLLTHSDLTRVNRVLVVCPLSTVLNWVNEYRMWLKHADTEYEVDVYELSRYKQNSERAFQLSQWLEHGGVCVLGYEMFRNLSADNSKKFKKKMLKTFQEALVDPGPDLVVCDEGHLLKNEKTSLSQSMNRVKSLRRIVLTGTPLQNNLKEYYCMVQFVKPNLLGKYNEYLNRFVNPITNGQYTDSTEHDIKIMKRRSHVLHKMLDGAVQRRDYGVLAPFLPPKHEYVLFITLSEVQTKLYQHYLDNFSRRPLPGKSSGFLFPDFQSLQRIWTHPLVLKYNSERYEIMQQKKRDKEEEDSEGSLVDFIDDDSTPEETSTEESSDDSSEVSDDSRKKAKKKKSAKKNKGKDKDKEKDIKGDGQGSRPRRGTRANPIDLDDDEKMDDDIIEVKNENPTEWWIKLVVDDELDDMRNSHKLVLLFDILRQCETIGDKLLVFSQSLYSLDLIEHFLGKVDEATQEGRIDEKLGNHVGSWSPGVDYFRLDGSTSCENRSIWCKNFNREDNPRARLFLISTRAGGLGINLVAANRVVIFDVSWNPSHDVQSIFRVYRFGQKKPCYVYRFLAMGTMEEKIYERQVTKQAISKRVIDEQQIDRHYAENDLAELYKFEPQPPSPRPIPPLPKDRLFAEMLREHEAQIYKYHEHDSLLENKEEETLSEEERKAAWEDFENEKNKPPPAPFPSPWPMHNGMVPSLLAQQQQQLAYAALASMLRKDMPNLNDTQLRDMLPLIYNANPQLMQKMSEIYKYTQPGMMNPAMMNPGVMNAASGAGGLGGLGGASGLQYEPPWQRQQQQQQQYRLQQLMQQQQNQMGAKFYAGGLGSRDPVAMALQQQRAREIMLGNNSAGRPRGRPPMQPRAPPSDVVNLDSD